LRSNLGKAVGDQRHAADVQARCLLGKLHRAHGAQHAEDAVDRSAEIRQTPGRGPIHDIVVAGVDDEDLAGAREGRSNAFDETGVVVAQSNDRDGVWLEQAVDRGAVPRGHQGYPTATVAVPGASTLPSSSSTQMSRSTSVSSFSLRTAVTLPRAVRVMPLRLGDR